MPDIIIRPSPSERALLEQKAAEHGMDIQEFVTWLLQQSLNETDTSLRNITKN